MDDKTYIQNAYGATLESLFQNFLSAYTSAQGEGQQETDAERRFSAGLANARQARDRALALL